jgi:hypothetical protein
VFPLWSVQVTISGVPGVKTSAMQLVVFGAGRGKDEQSPDPPVPPELEPLELAIPWAEQLGGGVAAAPCRRTVTSSKTPDELKSKMVWSLCKTVIPETCWQTYTQVIDPRNSCAFPSAAFTSICVLTPGVN